MEYFKKNLLILRNTTVAIARYFKKNFLKFRRWIHDNLHYFAVFFLVSTLSFAFFWPQIVITIHSGEGGVLYKRFFGTVTDKVYTEGIYAIFPWNTMYIYNTRIQTVFHEFDVLTTQGLPIHLSLAIRFRPEYDMLGLLQQQVGPDYINTIITSEVESVMRKRLSPYNPQDIYMNKDNILTTVVIEAIDKLGQKYITANDIIIRNIVLPDTIRDAIEAKLDEEQQAETYVYLIEQDKKEIERKTLQAEGIRKYQETVSKTLSDKLLQWQGIQATLELAKSTNSKVVIIGAGSNGMPLILGNDAMTNPPGAQNTELKKPNPVTDEKPNPAVENVSPKPD